MKNGSFPEPDIPADEAWDQMKDLLNSKPADISKGGSPKGFIQKLLLYGGGGLVIISALLYYLYAKKTPHNSGAIVYTSQALPQKEILADSSIAFLDRHSTISVAKNKSGENEITIKGAVYIEKITKGKPAMNVMAGELKILPAHANFYVLFDTITDISAVHVQEGNVTLENGENKLVLVAGESVQYDGKTNKFSNKEKTDINLFGYATLIFEFADTPLKDAAASIEKAYGVNIKANNDKLLQCRITTRFDNKTLKEVLDIMAYTLSFEYEQDETNKAVLLKGDGCD